MPLVKVQALPQKQGVDVSKLLNEICVCIGKVCGIPPNGTWAVWIPIGPGHYAEGTLAADAQPETSHPPLIEISASAGRPPEQIEAMLKAVAGLVARTLQLNPENVFVTYSDTPKGRVHIFGRIV